MDRLPLAGPFAGWLRAHRSELNARFEAAARRWPRLDAEAFGIWLVEVVDPLVQAVEEDRRPEVAIAAYDLGLEILGHGLAGADARHPWIDGLWRELVPATARLWVGDPLRAWTALSNGVHQLSGAGAADPGIWIAALGEHACACADADQWLCLGQVLAWRCGLAHFRASALERADRLPVELVAPAFGATSGAWPAIRRRLDADPWFDPAPVPTADPTADLTADPARGADPEAPGALRLGRTAGGFRGFEGRFPLPPRVGRIDDHLAVTCGEETWILTADVWGATFHPVEGDLEPAGELPDGLEWQGSVLRRGDETLDLGSFGQPTSWATLGPTLAVTFDLSHRVALVALS